MGKCHALAWRTVGAVFDLPHPRLEYLCDLGCHLVSQMTALMGPVAEVTAITQIAVPTCPSTDGPKPVKNEDSALA